MKPVALFMLALVGCAAQQAVRPSDVQQFEEYNAHLRPLVDRSAQLNAELKEYDAALHSWAQRIDTFHDGLTNAQVRLLARSGQYQNLESRVAFRRSLTADQNRELTALQDANDDLNQRRARWMAARDQWLAGVKAVVAQGQTIESRNRFWAELWPLAEEKERIDAEAEEWTSAWAMKQQQQLQNMLQQRW
jgi:chromosome segregation ATPase